MREIKFRAWDEENKCMTYDFTLNSKGRIDRDWFKNLMQYTGLKDKNGKEIYEGDILMANSSREMNTEVRWNDMYGCFLKYPQYGYYLGDDIVTQEDEVIGNIYETPELNAR